MKKIYFFFSLVISFELFAQSVQILPYSEKYDSNGIVYNNSLFFSKNGKLSQLNGINITTLPDPVYNNQPIQGKINGSIIIFNSKLCYNYDYYNPQSPVFSVLNKDYMITYDGTSHHVVVNPDYVYAEGAITIQDNGSGYEPVLYNGKLILKSVHTNSNYPSSATHSQNLWSFDGQTLTKINNIPINNIPSFSHSQKLGDWALVYNNELYLAYRYATNDLIAKFNGTNITLLSNNDDEYYGSIFNLNNNLYLKMLEQSSGSSGIAKYIPSTNTFSIVVPAPQVHLVNKFKPLIYNSKAYLATEKGKLSVFDGTTLYQINNPVSAHKGVVGRPMLFGTDMYFQYQGANDKYFLGKYTPENIAVSVISNLSDSDNGVGSSFKEFNGELYFTYTTSATSPTYLAKFNGTNITVFPNPDSGAGVQDSKFVVYGNDLYFPYKNAAGIVVLAKYGSSPLSTAEVSKNDDVSVYKENSGFSVVSKAQKISKIEIMDASGRLISNVKVDNQKYYFDINDDGLFIIKVVLNNGKIFTQKVKN